MLQICLLGERAITDTVTGEIGAWPPRTLALVGFLAAHDGTPQPRARIAAAFWPDSTEQQALTNLRRELHQLRQLLPDEPGLIVTSADLAWRDSPSCVTDLARFRREQARALEVKEPTEVLAHGRTALDAYGGELLPGLFDEWLVELRDRLDQECADLCDLVVAAARRGDDPVTALAAARRRVQLRPLEETGYRALIALQVEQGDRAGAVRTYHHCATVLEHELGIAPDPATRAALGPAAVSQTRRSIVAPAPSLVGRGREFAALSGLVRDALAGAVAMVVLRGEPGVGKSRLLSEVSRLARAGGATVLPAQCYDGGGRLALAPVSAWLQDQSLRRVVESLPPTWSTEVERLVPRVGSPDRTTSQGIADAWQRHRFYQGLARAFVAVGRPLALVLDNLQWCDAETLDFLTFLTGEQKHGLLVAMAGRDRDLAASPDQTQWLQRQTGHLREFSLEPFTVQETAALVRLLGHGDLTSGAVNELHSASGGFPFYVVEAARGGALDDLSGGAGVVSVLRARLGQLGPKAREVAALASAVGRDFDLPLLCEASDLAPEDVVQGLDELWRRRIVEETGSGYDFAHDLLRSTAYDDTSPPRRWLLHRRLAQGLELLYAGGTDAVAAQLAEQYSRAGNPQRAFDHYRRAADLATGVFAHAEAIRHNRSALSLLAQLPGIVQRERLEMHALRSLAASLNATRGYADAELAETWERLIVLAETLGERDSLVQSLAGLWATRFVQGRKAQAGDLARRALALTEERPDRRDLRGQAEFAVGGSALHAGLPEQAVAYFEQACEQAADEVSLIVGSHPVVHARAWLAHAHHMLGDEREAARCADRAIAHARELGHPYDLAIALAYGAVTWQLLDDRERLLVAAEELQALSHRYQFAYYPEWGVVLSGWARGGPAGAARIRQGIAGLRSIGAYARMAYWLSLLADVVDDEAAVALLDAALVTARSQPDRWALPFVLSRRALRSGTSAWPRPAATPERPVRTLDERRPS